jgi:hypothetical protein
MAMTISVGKNVARILDREFPIDTDLSIVRFGDFQRSWNVRSQEEQHVFNPFQDGEVSPEAFRTYNKALHHSIAFNERGKLRKLFDRKEEGVKIIPGHGVFFLPSKMQVVKRGPRDIQIRVFSGTEFAKNFHYSNYESMVAAASEHYFANIRTVTEAINESLWFPVKYNWKDEREFSGLILPPGVNVMNHGKHFRVRYYSSKNGKNMHFGMAKDMHELADVVLKADDQRHQEQMAEAMYRFVRPHYVSLSQYMKTV